MPLYEYRCKSCDHSYLTPHYGLEGQHLCLQPECGGVVRRVFSFSMKLSMPDGFNPSLGTYVSNERQLKDEFKAMSDEATEFTGIEHNFQPIDLQDREACGVTDEGLDSTYDRAKAEGRPTISPSSLE